ncbi:MAG: hypothetical protein NVSMB65_17120 [Chloroflexota bacterium]
MPDPLLLFLLFLKSSLLSFGGFGPLPILHQDFVESRHWVTEATIASALAVGRISPGPNGLFLISLGYFVGGVPGALAATFASLLPPFVVLLWAALHRRFAHLRIVDAVTHGIGLTVVGLIAAVGLQLVGAAAAGPFAPALAAVAGVLVAVTRLDAVLILALAALAGLVAGHL